MMENDEFYPSFINALKNINKKCRIMLMCFHSFILFDPHKIIIYCFSLFASQGVKYAILKNVKKICVRKM